MARLSALEGRDLPNGTRVEVYAQSGWQRATVRRDAVIAGEGNARRYALVQMDNHRYGWTREFEGVSEGGWWWANTGIRTIEGEEDIVTPQPNLTHEEAKELDDGTPVEVMCNGEWRTAVRRRIPQMEGDRERRYALTQIDDHRHGWSRSTTTHPYLNGEGGWWWADSGIRLIEGDSMATIASPDGSTRQQFPTKPISLDYWDPQVRRVSPDRKWVSLKTGGHTFDVFYMGQCLHCDRSTWACADGTTLSAFGNLALIVLSDDTGKKYRACQRCGIQRTYADAIIEANKDNEHTGPLVWPDVLSGEVEEPVKEPVAAESLAF